MTIDQIIDEFEHNIEFTNRSYAITRLEISIESYTNQQISKVVSEIEEKLPKKRRYEPKMGQVKAATVIHFNAALDEVHKVLEGYKKGRE